MLRYLGTHCLLMIIASTVVADDNINPSWNFGPAIKASQSPFIGGNTHVSPTVVGVADKTFLSRGAILPFYKTENQRYYVGASLGEWDTERGDSLQLNGMNDLDREINARVGTAWRNQVGVTDLEILKDIAAHKGIQARLRHTYTPQEGKAVWWPFAELQWMSEDVTDYYTGVNADEVALTRPAYQTGSDYALKAGITMEYPIATKLTLIGGIELTHYGDEINNSPIIDKNNLWGGSLGVSYRWK